MSITLNKRSLYSLVLFLTIPVYGQDCYDFGNIVSNSKNIEHAFVIKNNGHKPLVIKSAYAHCSCIETAWTKSPIEVGDSGYVYVRYNILGTGTFNKKIKVNTSDGKRYFTVKGTVYRKKN